MKPGVQFNRIPQVQLEIRRAVQDAKRDTAREVARTMRQEVPVDEADLKRSIKAQFMSGTKGSGRKGGPWAVTAEAPDGRPVWHYVNYGTAAGGWRRFPTPPNPFVDRTIARHRSTLPSKLREALGRRLRR